jgi:hypothetical protein
MGRLQRLNDGGNGVCIRTAADPDRKFVDPKSIDRCRTCIATVWDARKEQAPSRPHPPPPACRSLSRGRQPNNCCGDNPCRQATAQTESRLANAGEEFRRRLIALGTVSILSPTSNQRVPDQHIHPKCVRKTRLPSILVFIEFIMGVGSRQIEKPPHFKVGFWLA